MSLPPNIRITEFKGSKAVTSYVLLLPQNWHTQVFINSTSSVQAVLLLLILLLLLLSPQIDTGLCHHYTIVSAASLCTLRSTDAYDPRSFQLKESQKPTGHQASSQSLETIVLSVKSVNPEPLSLRACYIDAQGKNQKG